MDVAYQIFMVLAFPLSFVGVYAYMARRERPVADANA